MKIKDVKAPAYSFIVEMLNENEVNGSPLVLSVRDRESNHAIIKSIGPLVQKECGVKVGDIVVLSIVEVSPTSKIKKGSVAKGVIIRTRSKIMRSDGSIINFDDNAVVLVDKDGEPIATRVFGPVSREVRQNNFLKIASLASEVL